MAYCDKHPDIKLIGVVDEDGTTSERCVLCDMEPPEEKPSEH